MDRLDKISIAAVAALLLGAGSSDTRHTGANRSRTDRTSRRWRPLEDPAAAAETGQGDQADQESDRGGQSRAGGRPDPAI